MAADDERAVDLPIDLEDPADRAFARAVSGRMQYASVEQLNRVLALARDTNSKVDDLTVAVTEHRKETLEVRGWLEGTTDANGLQSPGMLAQVRSIISLKVWAFAFATALLLAVGTTAIAAVINTSINASMHAALVGGAPRQ